MPVTRPAGLKICSSPTPGFTGRQEILSQMHAYFFHDIGNDMCLSCTGFCAGKSQISFKFIEECRLVMRIFPWEHLGKYSRRLRFISSALSKKSSHSFRCLASRSSASCSESPVPSAIAIFLRRAAIVSAVRASMKYTSEYVARQITVQGHNSATTI